MTLAEAARQLLEAKAKADEARSRARAAKETQAVAEQGVERALRSLSSALARDAAR